MCGSMVDIQSPTAEIRQGKERKKKPQGKNIMSASATQGGHNYIAVRVDLARNLGGRTGKSRRRGLVRPVGSTEEGSGTELCPFPRKKMNF